MSVDLIILRAYDPEKLRKKLWRYKKETLIDIIEMLLDKTLSGTK